MPTTPGFNTAFTAEIPGKAREILLPCQVSEAQTLLDSQKNPAPTLDQVALWDTGATNSVITNQVATQLGLKPIGKTDVHHGGGKSVEDVYLVNIHLPNKVIMGGIRVTGSPNMSGRFGVIIGMDIISEGDLAVSHHNGKTLVSFRIPSVGPIDFASSDNTVRTVQGRPKIGRNKKCHCGSGKKFKYCHGR